MVNPVGKAPATPPPATLPSTPKTDEGPKKDAGADAARSARDAVQEGQQQAQRDQVQQQAKEGAELMFESTGAARTDLAQQFLKAKEKLQAQIGEFVMVFEAVVQEGIEGYRIPQTGAQAGAYTQDHGRGFTTKEQQVVREFLRQLQHLVGERGLEFSHALNHLKAQQGGNLWQQLSQILQKGMPGGMEGMTPEQIAAKLKTAAKLPGALAEGESALKELPRGPGAALAEMIRAETNPKIHTESMLAALAMLKQEGMEKSHRELTQYLRNRWGLSEREMQKFLRNYPMVYWQGPMPQERGRKNLNTPWYPLIALAVIPIAKWVGLDWGLSIFAGTLLAAMMFLVGYLTREKE